MIGKAANGKKRPRSPPVSRIPLYTSFSKYGMWLRISSSSTHFYPREEKVGVMSSVNPHERVSGSPTGKLFGFTIATDPVRHTFSLFHRA